MVKTAKHMRFHCHGLRSLSVRYAPGCGVTAGPIGAMDVEGIILSINDQLDGAEVVPWALEVPVVRVLCTVSVTHSVRV